MKHVYILHVTGCDRSLVVRHSLLLLVEVAVAVSQLAVGLRVVLVFGQEILVRLCSKVEGAQFILFVGTLQGGLGIHLRCSENKDECKA
ncbi:MAG: hypothetical protein IPN76_16805 [Saprospiraceae bacterium]|nr:hypothetical protein [Saprospiraceae bacterium]